MNPANILGSVLKIFTLVAVFCVIALAIGIYGYSFFLVFKVVKMILMGNPTEGQVILASLKAIDTVLLGVMFFVIGLGLFELFIRPIENLPDWFHMENIDQLKATLVKVTIVVLAVTFTGRIVTWDGQTDLLGYGLALGAVIVALSYFLSVKNQEKGVAK